MIVVLCLQQQSITHVPPAPRSRGFSSDSPVSGGRVDRPYRQSPNPPRPGSPDHRYLCEDCVRYVCAYVRMDACMCVDACMDARMYVYACMLACIRACIWNAKHDPRNQNKHTHMPTVTTAPPRRRPTIPSGLPNCPAAGNSATRRTSICPEGLPPSSSQPSPPAPPPSTRRTRTIFAAHDATM